MYYVRHCFRCGFALKLVRRPQLEGWIHIECSSSSGSFRAEADLCGSCNYQPGTFWFADLFGFPRANLLAASRPKGPLGERYCTGCGKLADSMLFMKDAEELVWKTDDGRGGNAFLCSRCFPGVCERIRAAMSRR